MKLLTWNIFMMPSWIHQSPDNEPRAAAIAAELLAQDFDVICFQKAFDRSARAVLEKALAARYPHRFGPANNSCSLRINSGVWVLSRLPLSDYREIQFRKCGGIECFSRKGAIRLTGSWAGQKFHLVGTHLQGEETPHFTEKNQRIRNAQMEDIRNRLVTPSVEPGVPFIICGDFGTPRFDDALKHETPEYRRMLSTFRAENGGEARITLDDSIADNDLAGDNTGRKNELDYVLIRSNGCELDVQRERRVFRQQGWDRSARNRRDLSYRFAVSATIGLQAARL
jgi:sphingomyelin phosphodiesterase